MKNVSDSLDEIMSKLEEIQTFLEGPKMWDHDCPCNGHRAYVYRSRS